ncbi:unnamed protein product, partial [Hymenolepis diminuta]
MKQDLKITLGLIISSRLRYNLSRDLINFGLQIASSNRSAGVIQIISFPISISPTWALTDNFKSLLTSFISGRIQYLLRCTDNQTEGITYLNAAVTTILQMKACKSAIQFGDRLSRREQFELLKQLFQCFQPFHCAHGRPSMATILKFCK